MGEIGEHCERAKQNINNPEKSETLGVVYGSKESAGEHWNKLVRENF